ncbi:MAG: hypothetical protein Q4G22_09920 [Paracoccus sp. (in: a-proteobacteria)]|uniref:DUF6950 family protein n=1 Tax=Paracoccus sp. TaxID=267 RepID=UPI0026DF3B64|nr:hypothetical protein [Paracoccus sp. (in: a-proteobacteria)]MDO5632142.1 hypothetical protein [Paracoccus sp. (in: a-proteobacteria)]
MRVYNWEARLSDYIAQVAERPFEYGVYDCALFAAGGVEAVTGTNPAAQWVGRYQSDLAGRRHMRRAGYADHIDCAMTMFPPIGHAMRLPGDLAVVLQGDAGALGILHGALIYVLRPDGLGIIGIERADLILGVR